MAEIAGLFGDSRFDTVKRGFKPVIWDYVGRQRLYHRPDGITRRRPCGEGLNRLHECVDEHLLIDRERLEVRGVVVVSLGEAVDDPEAICVRYVG